MMREEKPTASVTAKRPRAIASNTHPIETNAAFDAVFLEHWQSVQRALLRLLGDSGDAEDLALETFWRLYQNFSSLGRDFNIGGWLYRVAMNLGLNAIRARKRREHYELETAGWENDPVDPVQKIAAEEERRRVRAVLSQMDSRQAQLLFLRYSGMSYAELAHALEIAPSSVGTLLARAEREFEARYQPEGE